MGHYIGDGFQPLHDTIHHDGWQGPDPKGYTRDPKINGRFESQKERLTFTGEKTGTRIWHFEGGPKDFHITEAAGP
jgi:hypothetical protein